jgi:hypothetical protein
VKSNRHKASSEEVTNQCDEVCGKIFYRLKEKGEGIFISSHEILGIVTEEYLEFCDEVRANDSDRQYDELMDIAVAAIFGMVSLKTGKMDTL